jgi:hypothetical protein
MRIVPVYIFISFYMLFQVFTTQYKLLKFGTNEQYDNYEEFKKKRHWSRTGLHNIRPAGLVRPAQGLPVTQE